MVRRFGVALAVVAMLGTAAEAGPKKRQTAMILAGVGTGVSGALIISSFLFPPRYGEINEPVFYTGLGTSVITPSLGDWYAGDWLTIGMGVRALAGVLGVVALQTQYEWVTCTQYSAGQPCKQIVGSGIALLMVAGIAYIGGSAYDIRDAPDAVDRYNRNHGLALTPTAMRDVTGAPVAGLGLVGRF